MAPPDAVALQPGDVLAGRYGLVRKLGEGGMGIVWEARQLTTDRLVAVKVLRGKDSADAARFVREAKVAAQVTHRNVVQLFDFWDLDDKSPAFLVMELLAGETLASLLSRRGALSTGEALSLLLPVAAALRAAHARGIAHRDLKPDNVFLARAPDSEAIEVKVVDFGLAKPVTADALTTAVTQTGSLMGTPFYMAPEQVYGEKDVDTRADVWALGVVLYECLTGQRPFGGENLGQVFRAVTQGRISSLRATAPQVPLELEQLIVAMLSHDRGARPGMPAVVEALERLAGAAPQATHDSARPGSTLALKPQSAPPPQTLLVSANSMARPPQAVPRSLLRILGGAGLTIGGTVVVLSLWLTTRGAPHRPAALVPPAPPAFAVEATHLDATLPPAPSSEPVKEPPTDAGALAPGAPGPTPGYSPMKPAEPLNRSRPKAPPGSAYPLNGGRF